MQQDWKSKIQGQRIVDG